MPPTQKPYSKKNKTEKMSPKVKVFFLLQKLLLFRKLFLVQHKIPIHHVIAQKGKLSRYRLTKKKKPKQKSRNEGKQKTKKNFRINFRKKLIIFKNEMN